MLTIVQFTLAADASDPNIGTDYGATFATFASLVAATPVVTEFIKKILGGNLPSWLNQLISWVVGVGLTMLAWGFNLGFLSDTSWQMALLYGFGASLCANGVFDTALVQWLISVIGKKKS